jgi:site-specific DNA recombinase
MTTPLRCAVYTRKSSDERLDQAFNGLHAQRDLLSSYVNPKRWRAGAFSTSATMTAAFPARACLGLRFSVAADLAVKRIDVVAVYKVD